jgi:hypothetical protein
VCRPSFANILAAVALDTPEEAVWYQTRLANCIKLLSCVFLKGENFVEIVKKIVCLSETVQLAL